jgi:hypothetical protein
MVETAAPTLGAAGKQQSMPSAIDHLIMCVCTSLFQVLCASAHSRVCMCMHVYAYHLQDELEYYSPAESTVGFCSPPKHRTH